MIVIDLNYWLLVADVAVKEQPQPKANVAEQIFGWLVRMTDTQNEKVIFLFLFIVVMMMVDLVTGIIASAVSKRRKFTSRTGTNGLLRMLATLMALIMVLPMSVLIPGQDVGVYFVYLVYSSYLVFQWYSLLENLSDMGIRIKPLERMLEMFRADNADIKELTKKNKEKNDDKTTDS